MTTRIEIRQSGPRREAPGVVGAFGGTIPGDETVVLVERDDDAPTIGEDIQFVETILPEVTAAFGFAIGREKMDDPVAQSITVNVSTPGEDALETETPESQAVRIRIDSIHELRQYGFGTVIVDAEGDAWQRRRDGKWARPAGTRHSEQQTKMIALSDNEWMPTWFPAIIVYMEGGS